MIIHDRLELIDKATPIRFTSPDRQTLREATEKLTTVCAVNVVVDWPCTNGLFYVEVPNSHAKEAASLLNVTGFDVVGASPLLVGQIVMAKPEAEEGIQMARGVIQQPEKRTQWIIYHDTTEFADSSLTVRFTSSDVLETGRAFRAAKLTSPKANYGQLSVAGSNHYFEAPAMEVHSIVNALTNLGYVLQPTEPEQIDRMIQGESEAPTQNAQDNTDRPPLISDAARQVIELIATKAIAEPVFKSLESIEQTNLGTVNAALESAGQRVVAYLSDTIYSTIHDLGGTPQPLETESQKKPGGTSEDRKSRTMIGIESEVVGEVMEATIGVAGSRDGIRMGEAKEQILAAVEHLAELLDIKNNHGPQGVKQTDMIVRHDHKQRHPETRPTRFCCDNAEQLIKAIASAMRVTDVSVFRRLGTAGSRVYFEVEDNEAAEVIEQIIADGIYVERESAGALERFIQGVSLH